MTVYHAAYTREGYQVNTVASKNEQYVYEEIWNALARDWEAEYDYDDSDPKLQEIEAALADGDYKTAVQTYPFYKGGGRYDVDTLEL